MSWAETGKGEPKDLYAVLGLDIKASPDAVRSRYLCLAKRWHPDRHEGSELAKSRFQEIVAAFEVLSDEERRQQYDLGLLDQLDVEDYLSRYQGLILTVCGLGMDSARPVNSHEPTKRLRRAQAKVHMLTA